MQEDQGLGHCRRPVVRDPFEIGTTVKADLGRWFSSASDDGDAEDSTVLWIISFPFARTYAILSCVNGVSLSTYLPQNYAED